MSQTALSGRRILVSGASRGIGAAVCRHLAALGAQLVLVARHAAALEAVRSSLPGGPHRVMPLDVADGQAWEGAAGVLRGDGPVHGVVTAAAILGPVGTPGTWDVGAFRRTFEVNVVGTLLPILHTLDALRATHGAIVAFSGGGATSPLPRFDAYAASKAAVVRLVENLAVELAADGIRANCVAPGFVATDIHRGTLEAGPEVAGADYYARTFRDVEKGGDPPELAAELTAFLLSDEAAGITGRLISARWDPWREGSFRQLLRADPDLGRIRRIDRQFYVALLRDG